jgi:hypothetical protein
MTSTIRWPLAIIGSILVLAGLVAGDAEGAPRIVATAWFLLVCTGMSYVPLLAIESAVARLAVGIALSLAIDAVAITALLAAGAFSMTAGLLVLATACIFGCALQARRWMRLRPTELTFHGAAGGV